MKRFYLTTPIYYVNDKPHIGHTYTTLAADILARFWRKKREVFFLTGTDEHGIKNYRSAKKKNLSPKEFCDKMSHLYQQTWKELEISYDFFIRTTDHYHEELVKVFLSELKKRGYLYVGEYEGWYCEGCEEFKSKKDLIKGKCPLHEKPAVKLKEKNWFFKLSAFKDEILEHLEKDFEVAPEERKKELVSFLKKEELKDVAVSRPKERVKWGIEIPWDKNQVAYVWIDALFNYLTGPLASVGFDFKNKSFEEIEEALKDFWPAEIHLIGKDILRFHAVIWPALLLALNLPLPRRLFAHGFFTVEGEKISKTKGNVVDPIKLKQKFGLSALRYYLFREFPFGEDGDFSEKNLISRYNAELADNIGNLFSRSLNLMQKYGWKPPQVSPQNEVIEKYLRELRFKETLEEINRLAQEANRLIDQEKPWELIKEAKQAQEFALKNQAQEKLEKIFSQIYQSLSVIAYYLSDFLPEAGEKMENALKSLHPQIIFPKIQ
ncbi:methionine--tRNA ligase [bacterium]|nr:methionine--tRNA ligase [bacterium]